MNVAPPEPSTTLTHVPWVVVTWKWTQPGPGAACVHMQTEGAIVFPCHAAFVKWNEERLLKGSRGYKFQVFVGDPKYMGYPDGDFEGACAHVLAAEELL